MRSMFSLFLCLTLCLAGCDKPSEKIEIRPVRTQIVRMEDHKDSSVITGQIAAHTYVNAAFRLAGKIVERPVTVGSVLKPGDLIARLDDTVQKDAVTAATAEVAAAKAALDAAEKVETRATILAPAKAISQNDYDEAVRQAKAARAALDAAAAKERIAHEQLDYTQLKAEAHGVIADKRAEIGEVVAAGQPIVRLAQNETLDALFDMPEDLIRDGLANGQPLEVCLDRSPDLCTTATVYEIAPDADPVTRTYQTKATLDKPPASLLLGATVTGRFVLKSESGLQIPASALTTHGGKSAVWIVTPAQTVALKDVEIARYTTDRVILARGVTTGDKIVTAGVQALHEGQKVKPMDGGDEER